MVASKDWFDKDFYAVLGVKKDASAEEIKRAYKDLARDLHPDRNRAVGAEDKFKQISEAYDVLGKPENRSEYDEVRRMGRRAFAGGAPGSGFTGGVHFEDIPFDLGDLFGGMFGGGRGQAQQAPQPPKDDRRTIRVPYHLAALGGAIRVSSAAGAVTMKIPAGTQSGTVMRLRGKGSPNGTGSARDLLVTIDVTIPTQLDDEERTLMEGLAKRAATKRKEAKEGTGT